VREFRRRDRKESLAEIELCNDEVHALRSDFLNYRTWAYDLAVTLTGLGVTVQPAPPPEHAVKEPDDRSSGGVAEAPGESAGAESGGRTGSRWSRWTRRRNRSAGTEG
jgi:hypothetical protein